MKRLAVRAICIIILVLSIFMTQIRLANADPLSLVYFWIVGQLVSDVRQEPVNTFTIGLNPSDNNYDPKGNFVGATADSLRTVSALGRGGYFEIDPGESAKIEIVGITLRSNQPEFPEQISILNERLPKMFKEVKVNKGIIKLVSDENTKWLPRVDTKDFPQKLYPIKIRVWFVRKEACGLFRMGRKNVIEWEEVVIRKMVIDPEYLARAANDPDIQKQLQTMAGVIGTPPQVAEMRIKVNPEVKKAAEKPLEVPTPSPTPAESPKETPETPQPKTAEEAPIKVKPEAKEAAGKPLEVPTPSPTPVPKETPMISRLSPPEVSAVEPEKAKTGTVELHLIDKWGRPVESDGLEVIVEGKVVATVLGKNLKDDMTFANRQSLFIEESLTGIVLKNIPVGVLRINFLENREVWWIRQDLSDPYFTVEKAVRWNLQPGQKLKITLERGNKK